MQTLLATQCSLHFDKPQKNEIHSLNITTMSWTFWYALYKKKVGQWDLIHWTYLKLSHQGYLAIVFAQPSISSKICEPHHDKTNKVACAPSEDSDHPGHPPRLIRVFAASMKKAWVLSNPLSAQQRLCSDWADAQADLSLCWAHSHFVGFVMRRLMYVLSMIIHCQYVPLLCMSSK